MIRAELKKRLEKTIEHLKEKSILDWDFEIEPHIETPKEKEFGDYSTNLAFLLCKSVKKRPIDVAKLILEYLETEDICEKIEIAGGGFLNFYLKPNYLRDCLYSVFLYGIEPFLPNIGMGKKVLVEFVSSNPTGPLHVGHGRCAAFGDVLSSLLKRCGFDVTKEYYINDVGRQIDTLGESVYFRLKELSGEKVDPPENLYKGDYVREIAEEIKEKKTALPDEKGELLKFLAKFASEKIMEEIKKDLLEFGVIFDSFKKESDLYECGMVKKALSLLESSGYIYEKDGALWFKSSLFEKDEDRVLVKSDGEKTYFMSDIAYHLEKFERGYDLLINIWGSDHHGYIPRLKAALQALNLDKEKLKVILIQFVTLLKDGKTIGMSTREATYTSLRDLVKEVGKDAARFFFLTRKNDAHLEFNLDLAKSKTNENPVYYVQYAHARIESILRNAKNEGLNTEWLENKKIERNLLDLLKEEEEIELTKTVFRFFDVLEGAARNLEPHRLTYYLLELARCFHSYYNTTRVLGEDKKLSCARILLVFVLKNVLKEGLDILGVCAPERM